MFGNGVIKNYLVGVVVGVGVVVVVFYLYKKN